jgi:hypothetical protein
MIAQLETTFNITVDNDKAVSNPIDEPSSTFADQRLTYNSNLSNAADLNVGRGPTGPDTL